MTSNQQMSIRCAQCGTPSSVAVYNIVDAQANPEAKSMLLHEQLNTTTCPQCGHLNRLATPLLYHDAEKEMLVAFVPMELGTGQQDTEKVIGDLMNKLMANISKENFKAYMFNPKRALTIQGLIDQIIEVDGIDAQEFKRQKARVKMLQQMLSTTSEENLRNLVRENNDDIDLEIFQSLSITAESAQADGRDDVFQKLLMIQQVLLEESTFGKELMERQNAQDAIIRAVAERVQSLGQDATREDFLKLAINLADDEGQLQALVGLVRPAFDEQFFTEFDAVIAAAEDSDKATLQSVYDQIIDYSEAIDGQMQATVQQSAQFLQMLVNSQDINAAIAANPQMINDDFMTVLTSNIQESQRRQDEHLFNRLRDVYEAVITYLQSQMPPEMQMINELLAIENEAAIRQKVEEYAPQITENMPDILAEVENILQSRGQTIPLQRLHIIQDAMQAYL